MLTKLHYIAINGVSWSRVAILRLNSPVSNDLLAFEDLTLFHILTWEVDAVDSIVRLGDVLLASRALHACLLWNDLVIIDIFVRWTL